MKRIATFLLLIALSVVCAIPANAQFTSVEENARQSQAAAKKQQKAMNKSAKKQRKAMKKYQKTQRKAGSKIQQRRVQ